MLNEAEICVSASYQLPDYQNLKHQHCGFMALKFNKKKICIVSRDPLLLALAASPHRLLLSLPLESGELPPLYIISVTSVLATRTGSVPVL